MMSGSAPDSGVLTGVFAVDKPRGFTSFDAVAKLRGILKTRKIGHGGTLDPLATGVLPIFVGKATKAVGLLTDTAKRYIATARFGLKTNTGDITGEVVEEKDALPDEGTLQAALALFIGQSAQTPPMYSALKVDGTRLYQLARTGLTIERKPRLIEISSLKLLEFDPAKKEFTIDVCCSKGTYIRTLVEDIAEKAGALSTLTALKRIVCSGFTEEDSLELAEVRKRAEHGDYSFIKPVDTLFRDYREVVLDEEQERRFLSGVRVRSAGFALEAEMLRVYGPGGFLALAKKSGGAVVSVARFV